jgi:hypothetical protein
MSLTSPHPDLHGSILMLSPVMEAFRRGKRDERLAEQSRQCRCFRPATYYGEYPK